MDRDGWRGNRAAFCHASNRGHLGVDFLCFIRPCKCVGVHSEALGERAIEVIFRKEAIGVHGTFSGIGCELWRVVGNSLGRGHSESVVVGKVEFEFHRLNEFVRSWVSSCVGWLDMTTPTRKEGQIGSGIARRHSTIHSAGCLVGGLFGN